MQSSCCATACCYSRANTAEPRSAERRPDATRVRRSRQGAVRRRDAIDRGAAVRTCATVIERVQVLPKRSSTPSTRFVNSFCTRVVVSITS